MVVIDHLTVFIAAIVGFILGALWYSPFVFGSLWKSLTNIGKISLNKRILLLCIHFICILIFTYFLALFEGYLGVTSFWDGVIAGIVVWFGFIVTTFSIHALSEKKKIRVYLIDICFWLIATMAIGGILAG